MSAYTVIRDVTTDEFWWLTRQVRVGDLIYRCTEPTYGAVGPGGAAMTFDPDGGYPFFEVPLELLMEARA